MPRLPWNATPLRLVSLVHARTPNLSWQTMLAWTSIALRMRIAPIWKSSAMVGIASSWGLTVPPTVLSIALPPISLNVGPLSVNPLTAAAPLPHLPPLPLPHLPAPLPLQHLPALPPPPKPKPRSLIAGTAVTSAGIGARTVGKTVGTAGSTEDHIAIARAFEVEWPKCPSKTFDGWEPGEFC